MRLRPLIIVICCVIAIVATVYFGRLGHKPHPTECVKQERIDIDSPLCLTHVPEIDNSIYGKAHNYSYTMVRAIGCL